MPNGIASNSSFGSRSVPVEEPTIVVCKAQLGNGTGQSGRLSFSSFAAPPSFFHRDRPAAPAAAHREVDGEALAAQSPSPLLKSNVETLGCTSMHWEQ
jgi:hypothetical protein